MLTPAMRGIAAAGFAAALMGALAAPAAAAPPANVEIYLEDVLFAVGDSGQYPGIHIAAPQTVTLTDVTITTDFSNVSGFAAFQPSVSGCTTASAVITCHQNTLYIDGQWGGSPNVGLTAKPKAGAADGATGTVTISVKAKDLAPVSHTAKVTIGAGVDLATSDHDMVTAGPGDGFSVGINVRNAGQTTAHGAVAVFYHGFWVEPTKQYSNCFYDGRLLRACVFDEELAPGKSYLPQQELAVRLRPDTKAPGGAGIEVNWRTPAEYELDRARLARIFGQAWLGKPGSGGTLKLVEASATKQKAVAQADPTTNWAMQEIIVTGDNQPEFAAIGGSGSGSAGSVVTIDLGIQNLGPAAFFNEGDPGPAARIIVTVPEGAALAELPERCRALDAAGQPDPNWGNLAARSFQCDAPTMLEVGERATDVFKFKLEKVVANATGKVELLHPHTDDPDHRLDRDLANNSAAIILNPTGGLPITGVRIGLLTGVGALLLTGGATIFVLARRRRIDFAD